MSPHTSRRRRSSTAVSRLDFAHPRAPLDPGLFADVVAELNALDALLGTAAELTDAGRLMNALKLSPGTARRGSHVPAARKASVPTVEADGCDDENPHGAMATVDLIAAGVAVVDAVRGRLHRVRRQLERIGGATA